MCLTEETTETLYLLGEGDRVVGVSGYTVRPPEARQKPKISAFLSARFDSIEALKPDLVLAFSDLQADLSAELVRRGISVVTFNQRSVAEILQMIRMLGGLVGCQLKAEALADQLARDLERIRNEVGTIPAPPPDVLRGVGRSADFGDSVGRGTRRNRRRHANLSGAVDRPAGQRSRGRSDGSRAARSRNHLCVVVWQADEESDDRESTGLDRDITAVRNDRIFEIKSTYILQPGPASLTEGVGQIHAILRQLHSA